MDLNWLKINGYKRFENVTLNTAGKVIAILGPNEAGKSSLLQAIKHLKNDSFFSPDEIFNRKIYPSNHVVLEAAYVLNEDDYKYISEFYKYKDIQFFKVQKKVDGTKSYEIISNIEDLTITMSIIEELIGLLKKIGSYSQFKTAIKQNKELSSSRVKTLNLLRSLDGFLNHEIISPINEFKEIIVNDLTINNSESKKNSVYSKSVNQISILISELNELSRLAYTRQMAKEILSKRIPDILFFSEEDRNLLSSYNLGEYTKQTPPKALQNLASISGFDIKDFLSSVTTNDQARIETLKLRANKKLTELVLSNNWSSSHLEASISNRGQTLILLIKNKLEFTNWEERSDGLRQFIALMNFIKLKRASNSILLVDEAESHLHYNAQADLMKMFAEQNLVSKIIYTTHSAGCLPEDLGNGIRCVVPNNEFEKSDINNHFWATDHNPGFSSLLFHMGASTLAFVPMRKAIFVEGATDMILLPTIFRQVINKEYIGFQIAPGLSEAPKSKLSLLPNEATTIAFLVDNDEGGENIKKDLVKAGIDPSTIFNLPNIESHEVLEDYVNENLYLEAVNKEIKKRNRDPKILSKNDINTGKRLDLVKNWCDQHQLKKLEKREISYHLLEMATGPSQEQLINDDHKDLFRDLYKGIADVLNIKYTND